MRGTIFSAELSRREFFQLIAGTVLRSRVTKALAALSLAAFGLWLAYLCWEGREFVGGAVAVVLGFVALKIGWELLPFSAETRARWDWDADLAERYPSYRFRHLLTFGVGLLASVLWRCRNQILSAEWVLVTWELAVPLALIVAGAIATVVWHVRHARHHVFRFSETDLDRSDLEENHCGG